MTSCSQAWGFSWRCDLGLRCRQSDGQWQGKFLSHPVSKWYLKRWEWLRRDRGNHASSADGRACLGGKGFDGDCVGIWREREVSSSALYSGLGCSLPLGLWQVSSGYFLLLQAWSCLFFSSERNRPTMEFISAPGFSSKPLFKCQIFNVLSAEQVAILVKSDEH